MAFGACSQDCAAARSLLSPWASLVGTCTPYLTTPACYQHTLCIAPQPLSRLLGVLSVFLVVVLQAAALVGNGGGLIPTIGLVVGLGVSSYMMYYNIKRAVDLKYDDGDWPGPKAWPGTMGLISFFAVTVFLQAAVADFSTKV